MRLRDGRGEAIASANDAPLVTHDVEIRGGGDTECELRVPPSVARRVRHAAPSHTPCTLTFTWRDARGRLLASETLTWPYAEPRAGTIRFVPGRFELTVTDEKGEARTQIEIADLTPGSQVLDLRLPKRGRLDVTGGSWRRRSLGVRPGASAATNRAARSASRRGADGASGAGHGTSVM